MLHIAYAEDDPSTRAQIQEYLERYAKGTMEISVQSFVDGRQLLEQYTPCDILLLDVEMPHVNGMDAARQIRKRDKNVIIVFLTNLAEYAIQGYEVNALDFILKPIQYYAFSLRLDRAVERLQSHETRRIMIQLPEGRKYLETDQIYYLETLSKQLIYHTRMGDYVTRGSLKKAEEELADYHFARCNQCYLVNLDYVTDTEGNTVTVAGNILTMSKRNKAAFLDALIRHVGGLR